MDGSRHYRIFLLGILRNTKLQYLLFASYVYNSKVESSGVLNIVSGIGLACATLSTIAFS